MPFMRIRRLKLISLAIIAFCLILFSCSPIEKDSTPALDKVKPEPVSEPAGDPYAIIETGKGEITIKLLPEIASESVANFIELAEVVFYNMTSFHRVMKNLMIQGGDPLSKDNNPYNDGQGFGSRALPQEFSDIKFERGSVAMGRSPDGIDGGSCQFFIVLKRAAAWDGKYNVFGRVVEGIETAETISAVSLSKDSHPLMKNRPAGRQVIKKIRIEYREEAAPDSKDKTESGS